MCSHTHHQWRSPERPPIFGKEGDKNMKCFQTGTVTVALFAMLAPKVLAQAPATAGSEAKAREIKVTARKYRFDPNVITVKKGEQIKLVITALDHDHGFKLEAFNINQELKKGDPTVIEFTADKAGTFPFQCSHFCGLWHPKMKGRLVVEEP
jgi:cytochrome c oxidase subunit 2